jgi:hypothetical protein
MQADLAGRAEPSAILINSHSATHYWSQEAYRCGYYCLLRSDLPRNPQ